MKGERRREKEREGERRREKESEGREKESWRASITL